jgi:shikimate dehydrogenase
MYNADKKYEALTLLSEISGTTKLACLIGSPVTHSKSPAFYNKIFRQEGIDCAYLCFDIKPSELKDAVNALRAFNVLGCNVTMPHKTAIIQHLDEITNEARIIGAVNTVKNNDGYLIGYNTDGAGFIKSLIDDGIEFSGKDVVILGAGGAGRAVAVSLALAGCGHVYLFDINKNAAMSLSETINNKTPANSSALDLELLPGTIKNTALFINCTAIGMFPDVDKIPLDTSIFTEAHIVVDIIYDPSPTLLLSEAKKNGASTINGSGMLKNQAELSFKIYTEVPHATENKKE